VNPAPTALSGLFSLFGLFGLFGLSGLFGLFGGRRGGLYASPQNGPKQNPKTPGGGEPRPYGSFQGDLVEVLNQAIQDSACDGGGADDPVPILQARLPLGAGSRLGEDDGSCVAVFHLVVGGVLVLYA